eukprot:m.573243 g.573243  ORF g.573243 m.573243 type:complete len:559 (+) comp22278_c0_seq2:177-1853(+)
MFKAIKSAVSHAAQAIGDVASEDSNVGLQFQIGSYSVETEKVLAEGGFAKVFLVHDASGKHYALKKILVSSDDRMTIKNTDLEIKIMKKFSSCPNIVKLHADAKSRVNSFWEYLLLMELCPDGHLIDYMNKRMKSKPQEKEILKIFRAVVKALAELHHNDPPIVHRDIKPENVLIVDGEFKLCDFGSATTKSVVPGEGSRSMNDVEEDIQKFTTPQYRAPEMVDLYMRKRIDTKADIWALGCLLYKLSFYDDAFGEGNSLAILGGKYKIPMDHPFSDKFISFFGMLLESDPDRRLDIDQTLNGIASLLGEKIHPARLHGRAQSLPESSTRGEPPKKTRTPPSSGTNSDVGGFANFDAMPAKATSAPAQNSGSRLEKKSASDFADFSGVRGNASTTTAFPQRSRPSAGGASASNFADFNNIGKQSTGTSGGGGNFADFSALSKQPTAASQRSSGGSDTSSSSNFADFSAKTKDLPPSRSGRVRTTSTNSTSSKGSRSDSTSNGDNPFCTGTTEARMTHDGSNPFKVKTPSPAPMGENNPFANAAPPAKPEKKNSNPFKQ